MGLFLCLEIVYNSYLEVTQGCSVGLGTEQRKHPPMIAKLIIWAYEHGYELTWGDAYRDPRVHGKLGEKIAYGHKSSGHKQRLAIDFNLFKDGVWLTKTEDHKPLGTYWKSIGGTWGGDFADGNHYSVKYNGIK